MKVEQIYTKCLSQGSYYIESNKEVAIIDPLREVDIYIAKAKSSNSKIKYIFETHIHADFISGHLNLAKKSGAQIVYGPETETDFENINAKDYEEFKIGDITIVAIHTPGHTVESTTYLLRDSSGKDHAIFTGDTLFLGDVGRPDLSQKSSLSNSDLASMLFDSLRNKIMTLDDDVIIYPGHGEGSSCGKDLSSDTVGTLGDQKKTNYALRENMSKEEFINEVIDGLLEPPKYFPANVSLNKKGYLGSEEILEKSINPLSPDEIEEEFKNSTVLDVRNHDDFSKSHIPGSIFIGLDGRFAPWVGEILEDITQQLILVTPEGREEETVLRLSRVGFDNILGYLEGGIESWVSSGKDTVHIKNINANDFLKLNSESDIKVLDVRSKKENSQSKVENSFNIPLISLKDEIEGINTNSNLYVYCKGGYRSMIACSILKFNNKDNIVNILGGFDSISSNQGI
jgi:hydroxyacylglutathione hydrolase